MKVKPGLLRDSVDVIGTVVDNSGDYVEEKEKVIIKNLRCRVTEVYIRDYQTALTNNTINEVRMFMRYDSRITNKMKLRRVNDGYYKIKQILPDETHFNYMNVYAERVEE